MQNRKSHDLQDDAKDKGNPERHCTRLAGDMAADRLPKRSMCANGHKHNSEPIGCKALFSSC
jgi:hypothetical protein